MAKHTRANKHDKKLHQHCEQQLGLAHAEYDRILASGGKPQPKVIWCATNVASELNQWHRIKEGLCSSTLQGST